MTLGGKTLHCGKLMDMFKKFYKEHGQNEPICELLCNWNTNNCQKQVLSWRLGLKCDNCNFCGEKTKVYTESDTDTKKGQKYSTVNLGIHGNDFDISFDGMERDIYMPEN